MADHQFEHKVSQQLSDFKLKPNAEVWQQVEIQLEEDRKRRRWFFYLPIAALFIGGLLYAVWPPAEETTKAETVVQSNTNKINTTTLETNTNELPLTKTESSPTANETSASEKVTEEKILLQQKETTTQVKQNTIVKPGNIQKIKLGNRQTVALTTQKQTSKDEVAPIPDKVSVQKEASTDQTIVAVEEKQPQQKIDSAVVDQLTVIKTDTAQTIASTSTVDTNAVAPAVPAPTITKKKWQLGVHVSTGIADIRGSLFPGSGYKSFSYLDYSPTGIGNGGQGGATRIVQYDYAIKPAAQLGVGVLLRKPFKKRHSFATGLQYQYSSYSVTQRQRIDSFMTPTNMFSNISTKEKTEQFRMHALNVPLELEFKIADIKKGKLLFSAGIHNWFVASSTQTDTLSAFRYAAESYRSTAYNGSTVIKETKATTYQPQLYISPSFEWRGKKTSSQLGLYLDYGLRPAYKSSAKDYWWQTGIRYRIFFNR